MGVFTAAVSIGTAVTSAIGLSVTSTFALGAIGFLTQAAVGIALNALAPKPKSQSSQGVGGYRINGKQSNLDHQIVYGEARVGGAIVFEANSNDIVNATLYRVYAHTGHPIEGYKKVYIADKEVTEWAEINPTTFGFIRTVADPSAVPNGTPLIPVTAGGSNIYDPRSGFGIQGGVVFRFYNGNQTSADPYLMSRGVGWTSSHVLRNTSYMITEMLHGLGTAWPNGVPQFTCLIRGKKVYDPRTESTVWGDNPALCLRDYLTSEYGLQEDSSNIDDDLVIAAANVCDQTDTLNGQKRYTCNGAFTTSVTPIDLLSQMLTSMGGLLWYAQGKWRMKPAYWTAPTITFTEDDLRSSIAVKTRHSRRDNFNVVKGTFKGPETSWEITDYPEVRNQSFIDADNGQESVVDLDLPFTDNSEEARRIARVFLERNRQQLTVSASFGMRAFQVQVGDIVRLTVDRFGWADKEFEVSQWTFGLTDAQDLQVQMTLREISESVFDEVDDGVVYESDNTNLTDPFFVPPVGISLSNSVEVVYEHARNVITVDLTGDYQRINYIEVQYKESDTDNWIPVATGQLGSFRIVDLEDGNYDIRARAVSMLGIKGEWKTRSDFQARGLSSPPAQVQGFIAEVNGATVNLEWQPVADLDLSYYRIRYTPSTSGVQWNHGIDYVDKVAKPATSISVPARAGTYMIKPVDQGGRESTNFTTVVVDSSDLESFVTTLTQTEDPTFSGTKTDTLVVSSELRISDVTLFDALSGNLDSLTGQWDDLGTGTLGGAEGEYLFSDYIDIGSVKRARARIDITSTRFDNNSALFDNTLGDIDNNPNNWDSMTDNPDLGDTNVISYVSTTNDDPAGTPTWTDYKKIRVADISARAFRFKVMLESEASGLTPSISALDAVVQHN